MAWDYQKEAVDLAAMLAPHGRPSAIDEVRAAIRGSSTGGEVAMKLRRWLWLIAEDDSLPSSARSRAIDQVTHLDELLR